VGSSPTSGEGIGGRHVRSPKSGNGETVTPKTNGVSQS
jgi:hypothetical protein